MYNYSDMWMRAMADMQRMISEQSERIARLEESVDAMAEVLRRLGERTPMTVEKIEYHFEQLKVERLDGTLTIGLTPFSSGKIDQLQTEGQAVEDLPIDASGIAGSTGEVTGDPPETLPRETRLVEQAKRMVDDYLRTTARADLAELETKHRLQVGEQTKSRIIVDVERQSKDRIREYVRRLIENDGMIGEEEIAREAASKTIRDIRIAFDQYLQSMPRAGGRE